MPIIARAVRVKHYGAGVPAAARRRSLA